MGKRVLIGYAAAVMATFGLVALAAPMWQAPAFFFVIAALLTFVAATGWGLSGNRGADSTATQNVGGVLLALFGALFVWAGGAQLMKTLRVRGDMRSDYIVEGILIAFGLAVIALASRRHVRYPGSSRTARSAR